LARPYPSKPSGDVLPDADIIYALLRKPGDTFY